MKNMLSDMAKEQKYILISAAISFLLAFATFLSFLVNFGYTNFLFVFFIPFLVVLFVCFITYYSNKKHSKIAKFIAVFINFFIIFFIQIGCLAVLFIFLPPFNLQTRKIEHYQKAIDKISDKYRIAHFPASIPNKAYNVELYEEEGGFFGSEYITLKFNIDKKYIEQELKKYEFIRVLPFGEDGTYFIATDNGRINLDGFTFYIINDKDNENLKGHHFPYHYGIGVNKDFNQIVYYYTCPD